ncbi:hypothetical protein DZF81_17415 [Vibrio parahaemolyticus]|nr:hypothetical protein [Vibrio parahaemolyticus]EGR2179848.1 hypothetical protein [Vibrio parahaemolyticus]NCN19231.1 hypothetical protein [Vibrio parahaemolyticus]PXB18037.1 hypothetical protein CXR47_08670 [Vibrio parahaemolyticus]TOC07451.1 hypothetical protein CGJ92_13365 [Vibrio parahaemolyticus]
MLLVFNGWFLCLSVNYFVTVGFVLFNIMSINIQFSGLNSASDHVVTIITNIRVDNFVHGL